MKDNWDSAIIEILNSLSKSKPENIYIFGSCLSDIIYLKYNKKNIQIKSIDELLVLMENIIMKANPKIYDIINSVQEEHIIKEKDINLDAEKYQRWINFKKICKICNNNLKNKIIA